MSEMCREPADLAGSLADLGDATGPFVRRYYDARGWAFWCGDDTQAIDPLEPNPALEFRRLR